ncbi:hypothetical protein [uncultured Gimesia sp.]|uniref:hypothetical protein n=1 Tax=uncultured Gimesia sp. TaxID=1678688 RepID=UPI00261424E1|nr:hypothetical protein [uncultured Gimesia sp.]
MPSNRTYSYLHQYRASIHSVAILKNVSKGRSLASRIDWGTGPNAEYAIIDLKHGRIVEDANPATKRNQ